MTVAFSIWQGPWGVEFFQPQFRSEKQSSKRVNMDSGHKASHIAIRANFHGVEANMASPKTHYWMTISVFSKRALHSNDLPTWHQARLKKTFAGRKALSLVRSLCTPWEARRNKNFAIQTCLWGWYPVRFFGLIFGHFWGKRHRTRVALVRYLP